MFIIMLPVNWKYSTKKQHFLQHLTMLLGSSMGEGGGGGQPRVLSPDRISFVQVSVTNLKVPLNIFSKFS